MKKSAIASARAAFISLASFTAVLLCSTSPLTAHSSAPQWLVKDGQANARIVIAEEPPRLVTLAANELQEYIEKISGAELEIANSPGEDGKISIFIGRTPYTDAMGITAEGLNHGAFRMVTTDRGLVLIGHDQDFEPTEPVASNHRDRERARAEWQEISGLPTNNPIGSIHRNYHRRSGIWAKDQGGSLQAVYQFLRDIGVRWYMPGEIGEVVPQSSSIALPVVNETVIPDVTFRDLRLGNVPQFPWEDFVWYWRLGLNSEDLGGAHGMRAILSNEEYRQNKPEFYAVYGGEPINHTNHACYSNEELLQVTIDHVRAAFDHFDIPAINVMPEDGYRHCERESCAGRTPSEVVWEFVNNVAKEVYKTHPDRLIVCGAYTAYQTPPDTIEKFSPNVAARISWTRARLDDQERWDEFNDLVSQWNAKLAPNRLLRNENIHWSANPDFPIIFPRSTALELSRLKGYLVGENSSVPRSPDDRWERSGISHLNIYVLSRYFWDSSQDLDELLDEYYTLFYGPAADEMRAAFEFAENSFSRRTHPNRNIPLETSIEFVELIHKARAAAGDTVYGQRIDVVLGDLTPVAELQTRLAERIAAGDPRQDAPVVIAADIKAGQEPIRYTLLDMDSGEQPEVETAFTVSWQGNAIRFEIICEEPHMDRMQVTNNVWGGDSVAILIETPFHAYYHIELNADGDLYDADWSLGRSRSMANWSSLATIETERGADFWRVVVTVPVVPENEGMNDPLHFVVGEPPTKEDPWYFNVGRTRGGIRAGEERQRSLFNPTLGGNFHQPLKFARLVIE